MSVPNFSERSWPSSKRLRFLRCLRVLQRRPTCSCYAVMPFSGTSISSPQFSLQCVQRRLKVTMWLVLNQRYFKRGSRPSDKLIVWQAHQWLSPDRKKSRPARRRHPRRRLLGLLCLTGWALLHPQRRGRSHMSRPFQLAPGRARPRPFQGSKKSGKSSSASAAKKHWRVPGGGSPSRLCPALAESAGQLPGHRHRRGRGGQCIPATTSAHPSKHQFPDQEQLTRPSASCRCLADEGSHRTCHQREVPGFLQSVVSGTQEDRRSATCDRPVHSQPSHGGSTLQDGEARVCPISHQKSGVGGVDRHTRCLSSCADASSCPQVSAFRGQQEGYQFTCLPFGLATSPREFTKLLRPVVSLLRQQGVKLHVYLDDWLIRADTPEEAQLHSQTTIKVLQFLGCIVPLILIFWDVNEKHFAYAGSDQVSILILFYQVCWSYIFIFVLWDLHGKRVNLPMYVFGDNESTKQWHLWFDRGEASIWMKNLLIDIMRATYMCNQWLAVTMITRYCMCWMYVW